MERRISVAGLRFLFVLLAPCIWAPAAHFDLWQDPQERYYLFINSFTERTCTMVTIAEAIKGLMATYATHPPRKLAKQPIVVGMGADPEPYEPVARFDGKGTVVTADPGGSTRSGRPS